MEEKNVRLERWSNNLGRWVLLQYVATEEEAKQYATQWSKKFPEAQYNIKARKNS